MNRRHAVVRGGTGRFGASAGRPAADGWRGLDAGVEVEGVMADVDPRGELLDHEDALTWIDMRRTPFDARRRGAVS